MYLTFCNIYIIQLKLLLKKSQLQEYIHGDDIDIICLNETKIDYKNFLANEENLRRQLEDYTFKTNKQKRKEKYYWYWNFCKVSSGYSGVATLSKFKPSKAFQDFSMNHHMSLEGRCLTLQFQKFFVVNCYKPNSGTDLDRLSERTQIYDKYFKNFIKSLTEKKPVLICSDMNVAHNQIDLARPKSNAKTAGFTKEERQSFTNLLNDAKIFDAFRQKFPNRVGYTWWSTRAKARENNIGWRIDYLLTNEMKMIQDVRIRYDIFGSDHCPVEANIVL